MILLLNHDSFFLSFLSVSVNMKRNAPGAHDGLSHSLLPKEKNTSILVHKSKSKRIVSIHDSLISESLTLGLDPQDQDVDVEDQEGNENMHGDTETVEKQTENEMDKSTLSFLLNGFTHEDLGLKEEPKESEGEEEKENRLVREAKEARKRSVGVLKRAHMGAAGKALIPQKNFVNFADGSDSSEDEGGPINRVGKVPMEWYENEDHIGYDVDGNKIKKKPAADQIDMYLKRMEDPNASYVFFCFSFFFSRTIYDEVNDRYVVLSDEEVNMIRRIRKGKAATAFDADAYLGAPYSSEKQITAFGSMYEPKRHFVPSKSEDQIIYKYVNAIRNGWLKMDESDDEKDEVYLLWKDGEAAPNSRLAMINAPKPKLPGHAESYRPPAEYLFTEEEVEAWKTMEPEDRPLNFIPRSHNSMREIPLYEDFVLERFERCLDLYLCPRAFRKELPSNSSVLLPELPKPADLRPFPTVLAIEFKGHSSHVQCISVHPTGQWLASGAKDGEVRVWEVETGRSMLSFFPFGKHPISSIAFNPNIHIPVLAISCQSRIFIYHTFLGSEEDNKTVDSFIGKSSSDSIGTVEWSFPNTMILEKLNALAPMLLVIIEVNKTIIDKGLSWHNKGDYLASITGQNQADSALIHRLSKAKSQAPFSRTKGVVQCILFHHLHPLFFVATRRHVRVYNLATQLLVKKLSAAVERITSLSLHHGGDNLIIGSDDKRVCWFDMDLSTTPYKSIRYHQGAVNAVQFHAHYPLFCSGSADGSVHVYHGMVYSDLMQNPLIVPVKILHTNPLGVLDCAWHPTQPWVFAAGADKLIKLFH